MPRSFSGWIAPMTTADQFATNTLPRSTRSIRRGPPS